MCLKCWSHCNKVSERAHYSFWMWLLSTGILRRDFLALITPCTPPSSNRLRGLPGHRHTSLLGPIWHMVTSDQKKPLQWAVTLRLTHSELETNGQWTSSGLKTPPFCFCIMLAGLSDGLKQHFLLWKQVYMKTLVVPDLKNWCLCCIFAGSLSFPIRRR